MRIGILLGLDPSDGGIYQYSSTMLDSLRESKSSFAGDQFVTFSNNSNHQLLDSLRSEGWSIIPLLPPTTKRRMMNLTERLVGPKPIRALQNLRKRSSTQHKNQAGNPDNVQYNTELENWFQRNGIDLMIYPISTSLSFECRIPYVMAVHDLQHRLQPEFPEVAANGEWEFREYLFGNGIRKAVAVLADSEVGKEDILSLYGEAMDPDRVKVLPLLPSSSLASAVSIEDQVKTRTRYSLPDRYLFYPAQFWPHKNHQRIVEALGLLRQREGLRIPIVFCGSHSEQIREETFNKVIAVAGELDISNQIYYLGYVPDADISALYAGAVALVMPTFFGPTNIPVLEAWKLRCPVITSDIRGIREQAGDAALLVPPDSVEVIAEAIYKVWTNEDLRTELIDKGVHRLQRFTPEDFRLRLIDILKETKNIVQNGKGSQVSTSG